MNDKNWESHANETDVNIAGRIICPPDNTYSDTLKFSCCQIVKVHDCKIVGGNEDCIDMNNLCSNLDVTNCELESRGKYVMTIKGGTTDVLVSDTCILAHGSETDIDLGNWSDQSEAETKRVILSNVFAQDGQPVRVRVLWAEKPLVIGGNVKVTAIPKFLVSIWRWLRKHGWIT